MGANDSENGLWSAIVVANKEMGNGKLDDLVGMVESLSEDQKAELLKRLQPSAQPPTHFGTNHITGPLVIQISMADKEALATVLHAIAERLGGTPS